VSEPLLRLDAVDKRYGAVVASDAVSLEVAAGEVHAVIGPNGAGKSTLIAQIAGETRPDGGRILLAGREVTALPAWRRSRLGLARSFQVTSLFPAFTALQNVALAVQAREAHAFRFWRPAWADPGLLRPARRTLERVGLGPRAQVPAGTLAHGEQRQLEVAMALATAPRLLLLDEPTAGMGHEESDRMIRLLESLRGELGLLLVEHDMDAVFRLADQVTVLVYGRPIATGTPAEVRTDREVQAAYLGAEAAPEEA
jgi:branched-chain amino acid transport system ATP-binding protein